MVPAAVQVRNRRRMHKKPIARLGGLAIISGFTISLLFGVFGLSFELPELFPTGWKVMGLITGIVLIVTTGIIDDIKPLGARLKLFVQIAAAFTVALSGTRIEFVTNPFSNIGISFFNIYVSYILTIIWIVGITNAVNFIDGLDGLAAGVSSIASLSMFFVSVITFRWDMAIVAAALSGATLGFLPFNFNPAKIFMGDTGSTFLGFMLASISVQGTLKSYTTIAIAIPLLVLGLPLFDTVFAILRRLINKKPIMQADRGHLHHRLIDSGLTQRQAVIIMYIISMFLGITAIMAMILSTKKSFLLLALICVITYLIGWEFGFFSKKKKDK
jgi:UDP-GlcNAc:undecaprenyl-phosphate GlcNAc-1-phosphate transferase